MKGNERITPNQVVNYLASEVEDQVPNFTVREKNLILACRVGAYKLGLLRPGADPNQYYVHYNEARILKATPTLLAIAAPGWVDWDLLIKLGKQATNLICLCAYIFRWRGHHFKDEYENDVKLKWHKNTNAEALQLTGKELGKALTYGLHAIFPIVLDDFWLDSAENGRCCRPFAIRINVPCAGTAAYFSIYAGVDEAKMLMGSGMSQYKDKVDALDALVNDLLDNRWKGGVNRNFYNAPENKVTETTFSTIAAAVQGINTVEDSVTDLGKSKSLERVSKSSPVVNTIFRSITAGIYRKAANMDMQGNMGEKALARIAFVGDKAD